MKLLSVGSPILASVVIRKTVDNQGATVLLHRNRRWRVCGCAHT